MLVHAACSGTMPEQQQPLCLQAGLDVPAMKHLIASIDEGQTHMVSNHGPNLQWIPGQASPPPRSLAAPACGEWWT